MMKDYFKRSRDKTSSPEDTFTSTKWRLTNDEHFYFLVLMQMDLPVGFLSADIIQDQARILIGYLPQKMTAQTKNVIIKRGLDMFGVWAASKGATRAIFYTFRAPEAHKVAMRAGWEYDFSVYKKDLNG